MTDQEMILYLRIFHITFGVFWVGTVLNFALFIQPTIVKLGPDGAKFLQQLGKSSFPKVMAITGLITIVTGIWIMWKLSAGFETGWFRSNYARILTTGGGISIIAFLIGFFVNRPSADRIGRIGDAIAKTGAPPTADQLNELNILRKRIFRATNIIAVMLTLAVISMAICRYVN